MRDDGGDDPKPSLSRGTTSLAAQQCETIDHILEMYQKKDYFGLLRLEYPSVDALGRPVWDVSPAQVSKAYRALSVLVHPDKVASSQTHNKDIHERARDAFEALNESHKKLKDAHALEQILKDSIAMAKDKKEREVAGLGSVQDRVQYMSGELNEKKRLRKEESDVLNDEIQEQMREKRRQLIERKRRARERETGDVNILENGFDEDVPTNDVAETRLDKDDDDHLEDLARRRRRLANRRRKRS